MREHQNLPPSSRRVAAVLLGLTACLPGCTDSSIDGIDYGNHHAEVVVEGLTDIVTLADGTVFASTAGGSFFEPNLEVYRITPDGGTVCLTCELPNDGAYSGVPSPDGRWFLFWVGPFLGAELAETAGAGGTQLYLLDLETFELSQLTHELFNRVGVWSPDSRHIYWTVVDEKLVYRMWEGELVVEDGRPRLVPTREMVPQIPLDTDAQRLGRERAWYEAKQVTESELLFASTLGESGNSDIWSMDRQTMAAVRLTDHREYEEMVVAAPNGEKIAFSSSRAHDQMRRIVPFSPGPSLFDAYMVIPMLIYAIHFQIIPITFEMYLMNPDGTDPDRLFATDELGHQWHGVDWSPDGSQLLYTEWSHTGVLRDFFALPEARTTLVRFATDERQQWPAPGLLQDFDATAASMAAISTLELTPVILPAAELNDRVEGAVSGYVVIRGSIDLSNNAYDVTVTYQDFADSESESPLTGQANAYVLPGTSILTIQMGFDMTLRRDNGDWFESHLHGVGAELEASFRWSVASDAGEYQVSFP